MPTGEPWPLGGASEQPQTGEAPGVLGDARLSCHTGHHLFLLSSAPPPIPPLSIPMSTKVRPQVVNLSFLFFVIPHWNLTAGAPSGFISQELDFKFVQGPHSCILESIATCFLHDILKARDILILGTVSSFSGTF